MHTEKNLFSYLPIHLFTFKKVAFTLAEVLITLSVIGVVAAMTLPTLIQNHQKQTYVAGAKKAISTLENMFRDIQADEGVTDFVNTSLVSEGYCTPVYDSLLNQINGCEDDYGNPAIIEGIIPKYLKVVKSCKGNDCPKIKILNSIWANDFGQIYNFGTELRFYTADGMRFSFAWDELQVNINFDTNGDKGPNEIGRDTFEVTYCFKGQQRMIYKFGHDACVDSTAPSYYSGDIGYLIRNGWVMDY